MDSQVTAFQTLLFIYPTSHDLGVENKLLCHMEQHSGVIFKCESASVNVLAVRNTVVKLALDMVLQRLCYKSRPIVAFRRVRQRKVCTPVELLARRGDNRFTYAIRHRPYRFVDFCLTPHKRTTHRATTHTHSFRYRAVTLSRQQYIRVGASINFHLHVRSFWRFPLLVDVVQFREIDEALLPAVAALCRPLMPGCTNIFPDPRSNDPSSERGSSLTLVPIRRRWSAPGTAQVAGVGRVSPASEYQVVPAGDGATNGVHLKYAGSTSLYTAPRRFMRSLYSSITSCNTTPATCLSDSHQGYNWFESWSSLRHGVGIIGSSVVHHSEFPSLQISSQTDLRSPAFKLT
ncbi:hypothetical protein PR048_001188, partial [Dryococelus australis]